MWKDTVSISYIYKATLVQWSQVKCDQQRKSQEGNFGESPGKTLLP